MKKKHNKKQITMKKLTFLLLLTALLTSCAHWNWVMKNEAEVCKYCNDKYISSADTTPHVQIDTIHHRDTIVNPADSLIRELYFECDSNNQVILKQSDQLNNSSLHYQELFKNGILLTKTWKDSTAYYRDMYEIEKSTSKTKVVTVKEPYEVVKNKVPWWMWILLGAVTVGALFIGIKIGK